MTLATALRACALGWAWLALLWGASRVLAQLAPWQWLAALALLAMLPAWGLWLGFMVRKRLIHAQFSSQGWVARWLSGGLWQACKALALAGVLCAAALWQGWFLAPWEWALLGCAAPLHVLVGRALQTRLAPQFTLPAYAWRWSGRLARAGLVLFLGGVWLTWWAVGGLDSRDLAPAMAPQALDEALARIADAPSGLVRWGLDALLALQIGAGVALDLPQSSALRLALLALTGPVGLLWCLGWVQQGAGARTDLLAGWREPQRVAPALRAAVIGLVGVLLALIALQLTAALDGLARQHASPLALKRLPQCERIGQRYYGLGTIDAVQRLALEALGRSHAPAPLCAGLQPMRAATDAALERYLDWYYSLGAEWGRIYHLLLGDPQAFLQNQLQQTLAATPGLQAWMDAVQQHAALGGQALSEGQRRIDEALERHHLSLDGGRCLVQAEVGELPAAVHLGNARQRLAVSAVAGGAGAFAAVVAAKAASKASMKAAAKVLAKAAAKQAAGKLGGAGVGALAGAAAGSVLPGAGTALGAAVGAVAGLATGVAIDWAALRAEEMLGRDELRAQLRAVLAEQLHAVAAALACAPTP